MTPPEPGGPNGPQTDAPAQFALAADGTELAWYSYPGTGVPVLLVHGFGSSARSNWWRTGWIRDLTAAGRPVIAVDIRGHGRSGHPVDPGAYRLRTMVTDLVAVLQAAGADAGQVDVVGYSLGARVAVEFARTTGQARRLVLGGSDGRPLYQDVDVPEVVAALQGGATTDHDHTRRIIEIARALPGTSHAAMAAVAMGLAVEDSQAGSHTPIPPVVALIAGGAADEMFTDAPSWVRVINAEHPDRAELLLVDGRNHITAVTSAVLRRSVVAFLAR